MSHPLIEISNLKKTYVAKTGTTEALKDVTMTIYQGEVFGLLGLNGAGKSTFSGILATLHPPTTGSVTVQGKSVFEDLEGYRKMLGYCPQSPNLDGMLTLRQNLTYAGRYYGLEVEDITGRVTEVLEIFGLTGYADAKVDVLSGGYRQRFLIARTMVHRPKLVILDEPTVGLDAHSRRALWQVIETLREHGVTVILTTHYLDEAEFLSDRVCVIHEGVVKTIDTPKNLLHRWQKKNLEEVFLHLTAKEV